MLARPLFTSTRLPSRAAARAYIAPEANTLQGVTREVDKLTKPADAIGKIQLKAGSGLKTIKVGGDPLYGHKVLGVASGQQGPISRVDLLKTFVSDPKKAVMIKHQQLSEQIQHTDKHNRQPIAKAVSHKRCPVCAGQTKLDYKDIQTLTQYMHDDGTAMPQTATGICDEKHALLVKMIARAKQAGFLAHMPHMLKFSHIH